MQTTHLRFILKSNTTKLSSYVWRLKTKDIPRNIRWRVGKKTKRHVKKYLKQYQIQEYHHTIPLTIDVYRRHQHIKRFFFSNEKISYAKRFKSCLVDFAIFLIILLCTTCINYCFWNVRVATFSFLLLASGLAFGTKPYFEN